MSEPELRRLVGDLIRLGVGLQLGKNGTPPDLLLPDGKDEASKKARRMVRANLGTIQGRLDAIVRLWPEVATEGPEPERCGMCRALVFKPEEARSHPWAFCDCLLCLYRDDQRSKDAKYWAKRKADEAAKQDNSPIPD